jgi:hypothetical protein
MLVAVVTSLSLALPAYRSQHRRQLSQVNILSYQPGSQVTDHANIDLDQKALETALSGYDWSEAMDIYTKGGHSKPKAECTLNSPATVSVDIAKKSAITFTTVHGDSITGKAASTYAAGSTKVTFTYPVAELQVQPESTQCYVGGLAEEHQSTDGCIAFDGAGVSTFTAAGVTYTGTCVNIGGRTLKGFSTKAEDVMYKCSPVAGPNVTWKIGCPYSSYMPFYEYYGEFDYANQIVTAALTCSNATLSFKNGGMSFVGAEDVARKEMTKKGTAYMNVWMYVLREFEDAIDDCSIEDLTENPLSSDAVHAWDEGVAFYVGSLMEQDDLLEGNLPTLPKKGNLPYTLANKRSVNFKTSGPNGDQVIGEAKVNIDLFKLFKQGKYKLTQGDCEGLIDIKDQIMHKMTVPLVQGTLRYAHESKAGAAKEKAEGAIFAAAVLPLVHACDPASAALIYDEMNLNSDSSVDYTAVKAAFEGCYEKMGISCAEVGGLWNDGVDPPAYFEDAVPCGAAPDPDAYWKEPARAAGWVPCPQKEASRRRMAEKQASAAAARESFNQATDDDSD